MFVMRVRVLCTLVFALFAVSFNTHAWAQDPDAAPAGPVDSVIVDAQSLQKSGKTVDALQELIDARSSDSSSPRIEREIEQIVSSGLPSTMPRAMLDELPVDVADIPYDLGVTAVVRPYVASTAREPQTNASFPRVCYVFRRSHVDPATDVQVFCRVHYTVEGDADLALRAGRLLLLGRHVLMLKTRRAPFYDDEKPIDVWLCRNGISGGEQWRNNLYFYDPSTPRSSIEWIREILHEYSHLALPAVGGFSAPEYWANGYLGERLLVRWIERLPKGPQMVTDLWGDFSGAKNFNRLLIDPALALYAKIGPNKKWQERTDAKGMQYFIGQMLTIDDKYGSVALGSVLNELPRFREARPADVVVALKEVVPASKLPRIKGAD